MSDTVNNMLRSHLEQLAECAEEGDNFTGCPDDGGEECDFTYEDGECKHDEALDYTVTRDSSGEVIGMEIITTVGGPHLYIDTRMAEAVGYWGHGRDTVPIGYDTAQRIQDAWEELI